MIRTLQIIREKFHPLYRARKSAIARCAIHLVDRPIWMPLPSVHFKIRGRMITHGLAFATVGSQEKFAEALAMACVRRLDLRSFWDVGANIGYYSWLLKSIAPHLEIVLLEAFPPNAELIQATINRNKFEKTTLIAAGASDHYGQGSLRTDTEAGATSSLESDISTFEERHFGIQAGSLTIPLVTIDNESPRYGPIDFMKIDVEGHEQAVLRGALETIASNQPLLLIECGHAPDYPCLAPLQQQGYRFIDADRLSQTRNTQVLNHFAFPERFASSIEELLSEARQHVVGNDPQLR
jgi:FkbM family methyltransferase